MESTLSDSQVRKVSFSWFQPSARLKYVGKEKRRARQIPLDKEERLGWMELIKGGLASTGFLDKNN